MIGLILLMANPGLPGGPVPAVSAVTVSQGSFGSCTGGGFTGGTLASGAVIDITWTITHADATDYTTKVYANGTGLATLANTVTSATQTVPGTLVSGGTPFNVNNVYRVDVVRNVDGVVVSTASSANWIKTYHGC